MNHRVLSRIRICLSFFLIICMVVSLCPPTVARAAQANNAYVIHKGSISYYASFSAAWNAAGDKDTVGILSDQQLSGDPPVLNSGSRIVELNGHRLYRHNAKAHDNGEMFRINGASSLTVYGGRCNWTLEGNTVIMPDAETARISGRYFNADGFAAESGTEAVNRIWNLCYFDSKERDVLLAKEDSRFTVTGGLITGGWSTESGGAIRMLGKSASVSLYDVTLAGNQASDNGGAIGMMQDYQTLCLTNSRLCFNSATDDDGGAIYTEGDYSRIALSSSVLAYNLGYDNGGAIAIFGEGTSVYGDAVHAAPSDSAYPGKWAGLSYIAHPYYKILGTGSNPFSGRSDSKNANVSTIGRTSSLAYNIVVNSDNDGGGGGIYTDGDGTSIAGLNIIKNVALGYGIDASWCGRGAGIYVEGEQVSVANCNIWSNWSRSEGGGIFDNNDGCSLSDVTITDNYSYCSGWSGGGVFVTGSVNLAVSGTSVIRNNASDGRINDNLCLGHNVPMYARLYLSLSKGSMVYLHSKATKITKVKGTYDERMFRPDDGAYHVVFKDNLLQWVKNDDGKNYPDCDYPEIPVTELIPEDSITEGSRTRLTGTEYVSENDNAYPLYQGLIEFPSFEDPTSDLTSTFFYSDGYFDRNPRNYDSHLATASIHLALASFYSNDGNPGGVLGDPSSDGKYYPVKSNNIRQFLSDIGVAEEDIYLNDSNISRPEADSIGVAIGSKQIVLGGVPKTLVIVGVRGAGYEREWCSNMTLGSEGEAAGFGSAADTVLGELTAYLKQKQITPYSANTIYWVAGFSRAGATSNLLGARIVNNWDPNGTHTFVYTFEAPQGGMASVYENNECFYCIHNIINRCDLVPQVGPSCMGFHRYGVDHYVPGEPTAANPVSKRESYRVPNATDDGTETKYFMTWYDNSAYDVGSAKYNSQKKKMLTQLHTLTGYDLIFNDYFHTAELSFFESTLFNGFGAQLMEETGSVPFSGADKTPEGFPRYFINDLMEKGLNFVTDASGNPLEGLYRTAYSRAVLFNVPFQKAASGVAGILFGLSSDKTNQLTEMFSTLTDRVDVINFYIDYLVAGSEDGDSLYQIIFDKAQPLLMMNPIFPGPLPQDHSVIASYKAIDFVNEIWEAINVPSEEELKDDDVREKYNENRAKGYLYLQDILEEEDIAVLEESFPALGVVLVSYLKRDYDATSSKVLGTLGYNISRILSNHYPEIDLAWLRSYDSYYDNQKAITVMSDSALVQSVSEPVLFSGEESGTALTLSADKPVFGLTVPDDVNCGISLYYRFTGANAPDTELHPYCGQIALPSDAGEGKANVYTLEAFAIHDGIRSGTSELTVTVAAPNTR